MTHASVFSGIGGPEVAASMLGWDNLFHCEINPFGRKVLDYWYPNSKSYEDITTTDFTEWRGRVDVLTGGFPCQPFSYAGRRRGAEDDRYLWPSMYRAIDEIQPTWVVAENVAGILTMVEQGEVSKVAGTATLFDAFDDLRGRFELRETFTLQRICSDLESHGYAVQPVLVPACAVGAPHRRDRVFIVARRVTADTRSGGQSAPEQQGERERTEIQQQSGEQSQHGAGRPSASRPATDTDCNGHSASEENRRTEGSWWRNDGKPCEWCESSEWSERFYSVLRHVADTRGFNVERPDHHGIDCEDGRHSSRAFAKTDSQRHSGDIGFPNRWESFPTQPPVHRGNDGLPFDVDRLTLSFGKWRTEALKAYGNAIVPQVMYEIFRAIEIVEQTSE